MNSREGVKVEKFYGYLCTDVVGCVACMIKGLPSQNPNGSWIGFHHNEHKGSKKPGCHLWAVGLCAEHHKARHQNPSKFYADLPFVNCDGELGVWNWALLVTLSKVIEPIARQHEFKWAEFLYLNCPHDPVEVKNLLESIT